MRPFHTLPPLEDVALAELARVRRPSRTRLAPGHMPHGRLRHLWTDGMPDDWMEEIFVEPCPEVAVVAVPEVEVRSDWMPYAQGGVIGDPPIQPPYVRPFYETGNIDAFGYPQTRRARRLRRPAYVVTHFNMRTYGHFLLEVLPKLLIVEQLYAWGQRWPVVFPASMPHLAAIARAACPSLELLIYADTRESVEIPVALMPTLTLSGSGHLHDVAAAMLRLLAMRLSLGAAPERRLFLVRAGAYSFRVLDNEAELQAVAQGYGFEAMQPEKLPWGAQVRAFASASHVVGEFTSAIHNTVFCPPSAKVVCLNWMGGLQSAIAGTVGHEIGYLFPEHGVRTSFVPNWTEAQRFTIDPAELRRRLEAIGLTRV